VLVSLFFFSFFSFFGWSEKSPKNDTVFWKWNIFCHKFSSFFWKKKEFA
jgi:hypothetical protein